MKKAAITMNTKSLIILGIAILLCACTFQKDYGENTKIEIQNETQNTDSRPMGKEDGGGGFTLLSSKEEVSRAIKRSWKYTLHTNPETNPLQRFGNWYRINGKNERVKAIVTKIFLFDRELNESNQYNYFWEYLKKSGPPVIDNGTCKGGGKDHTDASVSANLIGASICVNISNLQKIPTYSLVNEILGLLIHELAHINGYDEPDAHAVQLVAATYFGRIASGMAADENRALVLDRLSQTHSDLTTIFRSDTLDPRDRLVIQSIRAASIHLNQIPRFHDEIGLEIGLNVEKPELCIETLRRTNRVKKKIDELLLDDLILLDNEFAILPKYKVSPYKIVILNPTLWSASLKTIIESIEQLELAKQELNACFNEKN